MQAQCEVNLTITLSTEHIKLYVLGKGFVSKNYSPFDSDFWTKLFNFFRASIAAIALVNLFLVLPKHLAVASLIPAKSKTTLTAPPALRP